MARPSSFLRRIWKNSTQWNQDWKYEKMKERKTFCKAIVLCWQPLRNKSETDKRSLITDLKPVYRSSYW